MVRPPFIQSLHRPFNQQLKTARWVCVFIESKTNGIKSSHLNIEFYLYLVRKLYTGYSSSSIKDQTGLPSFNAISEVYEYLSPYSRREKAEVINKILKSEREEAVHKQIYSTYKAASYYVNMAKDKFCLIDNNNRLTDAGKELLRIRSGFLTYTTLERKFFFKKILEVDFLLTLSLCLFKKLEVKYKIKDSTSANYEFLDKYYGISHFNFTSSSLDNYNTVRSYWLDSLNVLDNRKSIRKGYLQIINDSSELIKWYLDLEEKFKTFEKEQFKLKLDYISKKEKFESQYQRCLDQGLADSGFVNLYDVKSNSRMSHNTFEDFVNKYYEAEKGKKHIFFNNIVNSIDSRKRFQIRGIPVLKIKIK